MKHGVDSLKKIDHELKGSLELALYCDYFLRKVENEEIDNDELKQIGFSSISKDSIKSEYPLMVVKQLLNAIKLNSCEARLRFPRLLQIVELYTDQTIEAFIESVFIIYFILYFFFSVV
jgi:DNA-dependent protein kinase catalytic subunit